MDKEMKEMYDAFNTFNGKTELNLAPVEPERIERPVVENTGHHQPDVPYHKANPSNINMGSKGSVATGSGANVNDLANKPELGTDQASNENKNKALENTTGKTEAQLLEETRTVLAHAPTPTNQFKYDIPTEDDQIWGTLMATAIPLMATIAAGQSSNSSTAEMIQAVGMTMQSGTGTWLSYEDKMKRAENVAYMEGNGFEQQHIQAWIDSGDEAALAKSRNENPFFNKENIQTKRVEAGDKVQLADGSWITADQTGDYEFIYSYTPNGIAQLDSVSFKNSDKADRFFKAGTQVPNGNGGFTTIQEDGYYSEHLVSGKHGDQELQYVLQKPYTDPMELQQGRLDSAASKIAAEKGKEATGAERKAIEALAAVERAIKTGDAAGGDHTGLTDQYVFNLSDEAQLADGAFDSAAAMLTMENLDQMKGALSDADIALLKQAGSSLDKGRYWDVNRVELLRIREKLMSELSANKPQANTKTINGKTYVQDANGDWYEQ
ncbi:hypothetical protein [Vibrio lentus]|uniref:hypothetical protein n=1 Tax=Vibrio lentus TaxID=136468 RepID=UPI0010BDB5DE|nr:hypothetical protein [Vibrio lentus]TKG17739.1 hypothetical protein FCW05_12595 [Vibrio lentus]